MDTRLQVLENSGFESRCVFFMVDLIRALCMDEVDLVLLCNSLSNDEKHAALSIVTQVAPYAPVLRLTISEWARPIKDETILNVAARPDLLLEMVATLTRCPTN
jgi:hypothetical protein